MSISRHMHSTCHRCEWGVRRRSSRQDLIRTEPLAGSVQSVAGRRTTFRRVRVHTHTHKHARTHARTHAHAHTHTRTYAHARAHAGVQHAHTHTFMHAGAYYYHYGSHGKFDNGKLEWRSPDGRSLCQKTDKALIDRLKEDARRGGRRINADATIFGVMSQSVRASGGLFTTTRGEGACLHFDSRIFMQLEYPQVRVLQVPMLHQR
jgi:hypothetical protein